MHDAESSLITALYTSQIPDATFLQHFIMKMLKLTEKLSFYSDCLYTRHIDHSINMLPRWLSYLSVQCSLYPLMHIGFGVYVVAFYVYSENTAAQGEPVRAQR